jgi:uncharacterized repeat protein (TIGR01451 family)
MFKLLLIASTLWTALVCQSTIVCAADDLEIKLSSVKVIKTSATVEQFTAADALKPNDIIEYRATYRNRSQRPIHNIKANLPIPVELEFLAGTARPVQVLASTDGTTFAALPLVRKVRFPDGTVQTKEIPTAEYRALQWEIPELKAGQSVTVHARTKLRSDQNYLQVKTTDN